MNSAFQAATFTMRKNRRSRAIISDPNLVTPWSPGLSVSQGDVVSSLGNIAWAANSTGVTGTIAPTIGDNDQAFDGAIYWTRQWRLLTIPQTPA